MPFQWIEWMALASAFATVTMAWDCLVCGHHRCARVTDRVTDDDHRAFR